MKGRIALAIETRDENRGCSFRCPHLEGGEGPRIWSYRCNLFGELEQMIGAHCPRRDPLCVVAQIPFDENKKPLRPKRLVKNNAPTTWERINAKDKLCDD